MECINIDFIGPYPDKGYVLNFIDTFSRWVELLPVPEATAEYAAKCLHNTSDATAARLTYDQTKAHTLLTL
jgi:hypothetical protein